MPTQRKSSQTSSTTPAPLSMESAPSRLGVRCVELAIRDRLRANG